MSTEERLSNLEAQQQGIEEKLDQILNILQTKVTQNCEKMSEHIDFIDNVYDNVKNPLGFICNKVGGFMGSSHNYSLTDKKDEDDSTDDEIEHHYSNLHEQ